MKLTFKNFKTMIPQHILSRGREYIRDGAIRDLSFDEDDDVWDAQVKGTSLYEVRVELTTGGNLRTSCTCPYDLGEHCKHVAAVLYTIVDTFPEQVGSQVKKRRKSKYDKLREALEKTSHGDLVKAVLELAKDDRELTAWLMAQFGDDEPRPQEYRTMVKDALGSDYRLDYFEFTDSSVEVRKLRRVFEKAAQWQQEQRSGWAIKLYCSIITELMTAMEVMGDEETVLIDLVIEAIQCLRSMLGQMDEATRRDLFAYCLKNIPKNRIWRHTFDLFTLAADLANTKEQQSVLLGILDEHRRQLLDLKSRSVFDEIQFQPIVQLHAHLLDRFEGEDAGDRFLKAHLAGT